MRSIQGDRVNDTGQNQRANLGRAGAPHRFTRGVQGRSRGHDVIHNQNAFSVHEVAPPRRYSEGSRDVALTLLPGEMPLRWGRSFAHECVGGDRQPAGLGQSGRQNLRLVVAPGEQPSPVQGSRQNNVRSGDQFASARCHPAGHRGSTVKFVSMLEPQDQVAAAVVIAKDRPGTVEGLGLRGAGATQSSVFDGELKRQSATGANRRADEIDGRPAFRT